MYNVIFSSWSVLSLKFLSSDRIYITVSLAFTCLSVRPSACPSVDGSLFISHLLYPLRNFHYISKAYISSHDGESRASNVVLPCLLFKLSPWDKLRMGNLVCIFEIL